jgi:hypothetical protein
MSTQEELELAFRDAEIEHDNAYHAVCLEKQAGRLMPLTHERWLQTVHELNVARRALKGTVWGRQH